MAKITFSMKQLQKSKAANNNTGVINQKIERQIKSKKSKFNNTKIEYDNKKFDSKGEMKRYKLLKMLEKAGEISHLKTQVRYILIPATETTRRMCYVADFVYQSTTNNQIIVEDFKSPITAKDRNFINKKKLMKSVYNIDIKVTLNK